ncbi:substrate-binding periplasmic protein [Duganella aceris]|uniref:Transporter substrate-binding domain-containing protein n=1 Tax=Duganella aceris TaxID=2703883 RepID=A0ABX0FFX7_9BURK|nr:transporter substrate-binding domain-containing protein [Duganella aceris]
MRTPSPSWLLRGAGFAAVAFCALPAAANCGRPIVTPLAPVGIGVIIEGNQVSGIYPALLKQVSARTGCVFKTSVVPQARLESMFELGTADVMVPAVGTPRRDQFGDFVPMASARAMLLSVDADRPAVRDLTELLQRHELRVVAVRGNDYGEAYQAALAELSRQGRLYLEPDPLQVARLLGEGMADVTILTPMSLAQAMIENQRVRPLLDRLRIEELPELPWSHSGIYLSRKTLNAEQRRYLTAQLRKGYDDAKVWEQYRRYYPANVVAASMRLR